MLNYTEKGCTNEDCFRAFHQGCFNAAAHEDTHQEIRKPTLIGMGETLNREVLFLRDWGFITK